VGNKEKAMNFIPVESCEIESGDRFSYQKNPNDMEACPPFVTVLGRGLFGNEHRPLLLWVVQTGSGEIKLAKTEQLFRNG
jgi:hypothetical protein